MIALTLPDVCGRLETPNVKVGKRYVRWFQKYMELKYTMFNRPGEHVFLSGQDCYALRCSFLHAGTADIADQDARRVLEKFHFISPPPCGGRMHNLQNGNVLLLQTDIFCMDMVESVHEWEKSVDNNPIVSKGRLGLLEIIDVSKGFSF